MSEAPRVILSAFGDEAAHKKSAVEQFSALAALGLEYYSLRFIDVGHGVKNVMQLTLAEIRDLRHLEDEFGLNVASIGSPIGKVKLVDVDDGTKNAYVPFKKYLAGDVKKACELAHAFETKLVRGFSFYPPAEADPWDHVAQAADQLGQIAETCHRSDLTFGLEVEANLVGRNGELMAALAKQVNHPALVLVFDAANLLCQGYTTTETFEQYRLMKPAVGWMHVKDFKTPTPRDKHPGSARGPAKGHVDEETLKHFVPPDAGDSALELILKDFRDTLPKLERKLQKRGIPGVFLDLEPHLKGGGQFGGYSGPDGMGVALRALQRVLDFAQIDYHLRDFDDIRAIRGF